MKSNKSLANLKIASPCPANWEQMQGDDRTRFCGLCNLHVYNFSELTQRQAELLVERTEGRLCARLYRRSDGTVITRDCPVGLRALRRRVAKVTSAVFATIVSLCSTVMGQKPASQDEGCKQQVKIIRALTKSPTGTAVVSGTIFDPNGAVVTNAEVVVTNVNSKGTLNVVSDSEGRFVFPGITPGDYQLEVKSPGFKNLTVKDVKVSATENLSLEVILLVAEADEPVLVGVIELPLTPKRMFDTSKPGTIIISGEMIRRLPIP